MGQEQAKDGTLREFYLGYGYFVSETGITWACLKANGNNLDKTESYWIY